MRAHGIGRGWAVTAGLSLVTAFALVPGVASASGGGGCGGPVTDDAGSTVEIDQMCFTPTILRVAPGDVVTFVNLDPTPHTVLGANGAWGSYDALKRGREATYTFAKPGVYPYVCTWHVGMVGTVVVGDGAGGAIGTTTAAGPVAQGTSAAGELDAAAASADLGASGPWVALAAGALGLLLGTAGTIAVQRRRRRSLA